MWSVFSRLRVVGALLLLALAALTSRAPGRPAAAAPREPRCFPQTGLCINGRFRDFWQQHGGLPIFGAPITPTAMERNPATGQRYMTQWYEGARFEYHPENPAPDDVLLGNLGAERLHQLGIDWRRLQRPPWAMPRDCLVFNENGRYVCDAAPGVGFKTYWLTHGVRDPRLSPYQQSLALFGLPLTWPRMETNSSGERVLTQWFERARFEWHPDKPTAFKVLLGRLGSEIRTGGQVRDLEQARTVLLDYFNALHDGHYDFASQHYGGSYLPLQHANPAIAPNDHAALFQAACTVNGYQCLIVKRVVQQAAASSTMWTFTVEFVNESRPYLWALAR